TGLAISLGAQQIVRDVLNGFFILVEDQFAVGEEVTIEGVHGVVEMMGMRITRVRDDQDRLITCSNSSISRVINHSLARVLLAPGLWTQYLTTREPSDDQIEVAVAALQRVRELEENIDVDAATPAPATNP
ncbi:MAG: DUF1385 domain-containing protein, partial [Fimbriimonadales bacterium]